MLITPDYFASLMNKFGNIAYTNHYVSYGLVEPIIKINLFSFKNEYSMSLAYIPIHVRLFNEE